MRVLVVEDQLVLALDVDMIASMHGYEVVGSAATASQALEMATDVQIAVVDVNLNDGPSGVELGRALANQYGVTVIYLTANPEAVNRGIRGAVGVLTKPHTSTSLVEALDYAASRRKGLQPHPPVGFVAFA